ncbi:hypothetical protein HK405_006885 [Cladochytrium tenue]|nr:hypothetical protein HK405_006885 [Cladochytrium tenue]
MPAGLAAAVAAAAAGSAAASPIYCVTSVSSAAAPESTSTATTHASYGAGNPSTSEGSSNTGDSSSSTAHASTSVASYGGAGSSYSSASATQHSYSYTAASSSASPAVTLLPVPSDLGYEDSAPVNISILPFVDYAGTNRRDDACHVNISTNAGVRVMDQYLKIWRPTTLIVDAGVTLAADGSSCPAVVASNWSGIPSVASYGGTIVNLDLHYHNLNVSAKHTATRTAEQALAAYLDDRRNKGHSVTDGMGPLTSLWRTLSGSNTPSPPFPRTR